MKTLLAAGFAASALASAPALAEVDPNITATLKVYQWVNPQIIDSTDKAIARFKTKFPNVTIETQFGPVTTWAEYNSNFLSQVGSGDVPDIFAAAIEGFAEVASKDLLLNLDDVVAKDASAQAVLDGIDPNLLNGMRTRPTGELNFFPTEWNNILIYYNKDMFDKAGLPYPAAGWTWDEFRDTAKKLTISDDSGTTTQYGFIVPGFNFGLTPFFFTNNAGILDDTWHTPTVDTPEFRETLEFLHGLINVDHVAPSFELGVGSEKFIAGQTAMFAAGHWPIPDIIAGGMKNVGVQVLPIKKTEATVFGIGGIGITKASANPELAWEFIKEMTGPEYQKELAESQKSIPSAREFATTPEWTAFPDNAALFYQSAATAKPVAAPPNYAEVEEIFMRHVAAYMNNNQDIDTTIQGLQDELSRAMERAYQ